METILTIEEVRKQHCDAIKQSILLSVQDQISKDPTTAVFTYNTRVYNSFKEPKHISEVETIKFVLKDMGCTTVETIDKEQELSDYKTSYWTVIQFVLVV